MDIHNIPIAQITNEFLNYLHQLKVMNIEVASEFILVAATLMRIKAKMLLPRHEVDAEGNEIDPRQDLVAQLLNYKRYKAAAAELQEKETERMLKEKRGNIQQELAQIAQNSTYADELNYLTLFKLLSTFEKVISRHNREQGQATHTVFQYAYTVEGQKAFLMEAIESRQKMSFVEVLEQCKDRYQVIFTFMAILELLQERIVNITIGLGFNNFWLAQGEPTQI